MAPREDLNSAVVGGLVPRPSKSADLDYVLGKTLPDWEQMRNGRLLITGGTGFFGCWLLETFLHANGALDLNARVTVLGRSFERFEQRAPHLAHHPRVWFLSGDIREFQFPAGEFSHIIHAATDSTLPITIDNADEVLASIIDGTYRVLRFAKRCGAQKMLLASSGAVYGPQPRELAQVPEEFNGGPVPTNPAGSYGEGKRVAEMLWAQAGAVSGIDATIARCFAFVGPHLPLNAHFAIGNFIRDALAGQPIEVKSDGTPLRSYLYAADLAVWLWTILFRGESARAYNVGSENAISIAGLAAMVSNCLPEPVPVQIQQIPESGKLPARYVPSTRRARVELGLSQHYSLELAIRNTLKYHQELALASTGREALYVTR